MSRLKQILPIYKLFMLPILGLLSASQGLAQHGNVWALGYKRGLDFNAKQISIIKTSIVHDTFYFNTDPALASVSYSDCNGKVIVYGSHMQLWNRLHKPMKGAYFPRSYQLGLLLLPKPGNSRYLYFFYHTADGICLNRNLRYALIDLNADNGLGEVIFKDKLVGDGGSSSMTYVRHTNNRDLWIVHGSTYNITKCYLLTDTGLITTPVINNNVFSYNHCRAYYSSNYDALSGTFPIANAIKATRDGKNLINSGIDSSTTKTGCVLIYDFNNLTGVINNPQVLMKFSDIPKKNTSYQGNYFVNEISPNDSFIYLGEFSSATKQTIVQINRFTKQKRTVYRPDFVWGLQLGPDGRIYFIGSYSSTTGIWDLYAITKPNLPGIKCAVRKILSDSFIHFRLPPQTYDPYRQLTFNSNLESNRCRDTAEFDILVDTSFQDLTVYYGDGDSVYFSKLNKTRYPMSHTYSKTGWYEVRLKARNPGCSSFSYWSDSVYFAQPPKRVWREVNVIPNCEGSALHIKDSFIHTNMAVYRWIATGIKPDTIILPKNPSLSEWFDRDSNWTRVKWQIALSNVDCPNYTTFIDSVDLSYLTLPVPSHVLNGLSADTLEGCQPFVVNMANNSLNSKSFHADWGDGELVTQSSPYGLGPKLYRMMGTYLLTVSDTSIDACTSLDSFRIIVHGKPDSRIESPSEASCYRDNTFYINAASDMECTYIWELPQNNGFNMPDDSTITNLKLSNTGYSNVTLYSNTIYGCKDTTAIMLRLMEELRAVFSGDSTAKCHSGNSFTILHDKDIAGKGTKTTYEYDLSNGSFEPLTETISYGSPGTYAFKYILSDSMNCRDSLEILHRVFSHPTLELKLRDTCFGNSVKLDFSAKNQIQSFQIYSGDGAKYNTAAYHKYQAPSTYNVSIKASNKQNCSDSISQNIRIYGKPLAGLITDSVCQGEILQILPICNNMAWDSLSNMQIDWINHTKIISSPNVIQIPGQDAGVLKIRNIVSSIHGCKDSIEKEAIVYSLPIADFTWKRLGSTNTGIEVQFLDKSFDGNANAWDFGDGQSISNMLNPKHLFTDSGSYLVSFLVSNKEGCQDKKTEFVRVIPYLPVFIPNAFSPNGDGINDIYTPSGTLLLNTWILTIYNRWGEIIFEGENKGWDGLDKNGVRFQSGVYTYRLTTQALDKQKVNYSGILHLEY